VSWLLLVLFLLPLFAIAWLARAFFRSLAMGKEADSERRSQPRPPPLRVRDPLEDIKNRDPQFSEPVFLDQARTAFTAIQDAWEKRSIDGVRVYLTDDTAKRFAIQVEEMRARGERNILDQLVIDEARVVKGGCGGGADSVTVRFGAHMVDYVVDEKSGRLVDGSMQPRPFVELWTFVRRYGASGTACSACGAPRTDSATCGYCGNPAASRGIGWVVSGIDPVV
jgi:predicted lipid-binding transport protein (Tim44 family)